MCVRRYSGSRQLHSSAHHTGRSLDTPVAPNVCVRSPSTNKLSLQSAVCCRSSCHRSCHSIAWSPRTFTRSSSSSASGRSARTSHWWLSPRFFANSARMARPTHASISPSFSWQAAPCPHCGHVPSRPPRLLAPLDPAQPSVANRLLAWHLALQTPPWPHGPLVLPHAHVTPPRRHGISLQLYLLRVAPRNLFASTAPRNLLCNSDNSTVSCNHGISPFLSI